MTHTDPDMLAMAAMGEAVSPADSAHLDDCPDCSVELASLRHVADLARSGLQEQTLQSPAPAVWSRISGQLGFDADVQPAPFPVVSSSAAAEPPRAHRAPVRGWADPAAGSGPVRRSSGRRVAQRRWLAPALLAAAGIVLVAGSAVAIIVQQGTSPTVLAEAELDPLPDWAGSSGDARVEEAQGGGRDLVVTTSGSTGAEGYREVWLISPDLTGLVSLGVLEGRTGTFSIPAGVDLADYPIVDVSQEPLDGNPAHSGDSIVRGTVG